MTTTQRGYGWRHQQQRERWLPVVERGDAYCAEPVCLEPTRWIEPGSPWHLVHDHETGEYRGPGHPRCNIAESNRRMVHRGFNGHNALTPHYVNPTHYSGESGAILFGGVELRPELLWDAHIRGNPGWLTPWLEMPEDAAPPLAMTPVHPSAVGSYGPEALEWLESKVDTLGIGRPTPLRWWQRLALVRQLEHDEDGRLCWPVVIESASRRVGKSVRLRSMALWRLANAERFGEPQLAIHTGKDLAIVREIQRRAWPWAQLNGWRVLTALGREAIETYDGVDRWLARSSENVYGYDITLGMVDEAWAVDEGAITEGMEPATLERVSPQIVLTSTAHRRATGLMRSRIRDALLADTDTLLMLWSVPDGADMGLESTWRKASAHWSEDRARLVAAKYARASAGQQDTEFDDPDPLAGFASQYLNRWQLGAVVKPDTAIDPALWAECAVVVEHVGGASYAVEVETGLRSASIASAGATGDGPVWVDVERLDGIEWVAGRLVELGVTSVAMDSRGASGALVTPLEDAGVMVVPLDTGDAIRACGRFQAGVLARQIVNPDRPVLNDAVAAAQKRDIGDQGGWVFGRKKSNRDISALQACAWAKWFHDQGAHYDVMESFV